MHPHLDFDLLGAQIEACHEIGVECPIYYTVGWSAHDAETHPDWCARHKDGSFIWRGDPGAEPTDPYPPGNLKLLCPSGPYHEMMRAQVDEICQRYAVDGFWFDTFRFSTGCYCDRCRASMAEKGIDIDDEEAVVAHFAGVYKAHKRRTYERPLRLTTHTQPCSSTGPRRLVGKTSATARTCITPIRTSRTCRDAGALATSSRCDRSITLAKATRSVR